MEDKLHALVGAYTSAPDWFKSLVGGLYAALPMSLRFGRSYERFLSMFEASSAAVAYGQLALASTLRVALHDVPAYAQYRHLADGLGDDPRGVLRELPLTSKEALKATPRRYVNPRVPASSRLRMFTGGSTAVPMTVYLRKGVTRAREWAAFAAMSRALGVDDGRSVVLALRGRTVHGGWQEGRPIYTYEPIKRHVIASSDHLEPRFMPRYVDALRRWKPSYVHAFPSALYPLMVWLRENGLEELLFNVRGVLLTSESVLPHQLAAFKAFFRCPVIVHYGHTERVLFAHTLADDARYVFWPHYGYFELVDERGMPITAPGQLGEIVGTSFDNDVMPFVRYRTGDFATLSPHAPPSAYAGFPSCERIEGRLQEFVVCKDQRLITVTTLGAAHFEELARCLRIQYEQHEPGRLMLRVVSSTPLGKLSRQRIERAVAEKTQQGCSVQVEQVERIELTARGKQRLLVQHLPIAHYLGAAMSSHDAPQARNAEQP
jgi:phenylacetate-CoA ligase